MEKEQQEKIYHELKELQKNKTCSYYLRTAKIEKTHFGEESEGNYQISIYLYVVEKEAIKEITNIIGIWFCWQVVPNRNAKIYNDDRLMLEIW